MSTRPELAEEASVAREVRLAAQGPTVIEADVGGDLDVPQTASGPGLLDRQFGGFLQELGLHVA